jgi:predicted Zn-dependent peptidase
VLSSHPSIIPEVAVPASESSLIYQHIYPNGLALVAEAMPSVQSAAFSLLLPAGAAYEPGDQAGSASMRLPSSAVQIHP